MNDYRPLARASFAEYHRHPYRAHVVEGPGTAQDVLSCWFDPVNRLKIVIVELPSTRTGTRAVRNNVILEALKLRENASERQFIFIEGGFALRSSAQFGLWSVTRS